MARRPEGAPRGWSPWHNVGWFMVFYPVRDDLGINAKIFGKIVQLFAVRLERIISQPRRRQRRRGRWGNQRPTTTGCRPAGDPCLWATGTAGRPGTRLTCGRDVRSADSRSAMISRPSGILKQRRIERCTQNRTRRSLFWH